MNYPPIRYSNLKKMAVSPHHYNYAAHQPFVRAKQSHLLIGSAVHSLVLGAGPQVVTFEGKVRRGKEWDAFEAAHPDDIILNQKESAQAHRMAQAALASTRVQELLAAAPTREQTLCWDLGGKACTGTPDAYGPDVLLEVKTCNDAHPERFLWQARRLHYPGQLSWYRAALETFRGMGSQKRQCFIICIENSAACPPPVIRPVDEALLDEGFIEWRAWFERLSGCIDSNHYPGYAEGDVPLEKPEELFADVPTEEEEEEDDATELSE